MCLDQISLIFSTTRFLGDKACCSSFKSTNEALYHFFSPSVSSSSDVALSCDSNIPLVAQELMRKMIRQFALEYASKCLPHTSVNGVTTRTSSPVSETSDAPLDLTVSRTQEDKESESEPGRKSIKHVLNLKPIHKKFQSCKVKL